jgi:cobalamin biosynthesis Mg chelatase CobN
MEVIIYLAEYQIVQGMSIKRTRATHKRSMKDALDAYIEIQDKIIKDTKISDILQDPELVEFSKKICRQHLAHLPAESSDKVCACLNEKNGDMTVTDLEERTGSYETTPGSECITLYDSLTRKAAASTARKSASSTRKSASSTRKSASSTRKSASSTRKSASSTRKSASSTHKSASSTRKSASSTRKSASGGRKSAYSTRKSASGGRKSASSTRKSASGGRKSAVGG